MNTLSSGIQGLQAIQTTLSGKVILMRADLNLPLDDQRHVTDDTRLREILPTLQFLLKTHVQRVFLCTHFGRPKGQVNEAFNLVPVAQALQQALPNTPVHYASGCLTPTQAMASGLPENCPLILLENVRFDAREEANDASFSQALAQGIDVYVNDAFGTSHRAHASTTGVASYVPVKVAGLLMEKELKAMGGVLDNPKRPLTAIIGGSKVSSKIAVIENLLSKVDTLIIGGGMAFTFFAAQGYEVGNSLLEPNFIDTARMLLDKAKGLGVQLCLPVDTVTAASFPVLGQPVENLQIVSATAIPSTQMGLDIGPESRQQFSAIIAASQTILWNGPMGVFEIPPFDAGTRAVAQAVANSQAISVLGGGDTVAAIGAFDMPADAFTHISTGGGASLEFLEGKTLPGIAALG